MHGVTLRRLVRLGRFALLIVLIAAWCGGSVAAASKAKAQDGEDDWRFEEEYAKRNQPRGGPGTGAGNAVAPAMPAPGVTQKVLRAPAAMGRIGLATGGAKDIANFRENLAKGFLPQPTDVTCEGVFYDYYFNVGGDCEKDQLFCPTYATAVSKDPFDGKAEYYLSVGLGSSLDAATFRRAKLNLMIVLDISGSMSSPFDSYYYDRFGGGRREAAQDADRGKSKLEVAAASVIALLDQLRPDDRFGLVLFDHYAYPALTLRPVAARDMEAIKGHIRALRAMGGTNLEAGLSLAGELMEPAAGSDPKRYENRVVFMTDAMPNLGDTSDKSFLARIADNAKARLYTTVIGIGVDFNTALTERITKARGANYYSIHTPAEFRKRLGEEFDAMVTPVVFDLALDFQSRGYAIEAVYGSPEADAATGSLMRVNTLFPSPTNEEAARGGLVLLRLRQTGDDPEIVLTATYEDRDGGRHKTAKRLSFPPRQEGCDTVSIRKGILLSRYVTLLKEWLVSANDQVPAPPKTESGSPRRPGDRPELGQWERQSRQVRLTAAQRAKFAAFRQYFRAEMARCDDKGLARELEVLNGLAGGAARPAAP